MREIGALKDKIAEIEIANDEMAKQNDTFRDGANEGMQLVKQVE